LAVRNAVISSRPLMKLSRLRQWTTGSENHGAQQFYAELGLPLFPKVFYRIEDTGSGFQIPG
jgi:hypothetical protein